MSLYSKLSWPARWSNFCRHFLTKHNGIWVVKQELCFIFSTKTSSTEFPITSQGTENVSRSKAVPLCVVQHLSANSIKWSVLAWSCSAWQGPSVCFILLCCPVYWSPALQWAFRLCGNKKSSSIHCWIIDTALQSNEPLRVVLRSGKHTRSITSFSYLDFSWSYPIQMLCKCNFI